VSTETYGKMSSSVTLRNQLELFLTAVQFLTRLPVPGTLPYSSERLNASTAYYPVVGFLIGGLSALVVLACPTNWHIVTKLLLSTALAVALTGAFHEDGLADACDGFGGGWTKARVLEIMKDSRLGTFGVVGLGLALSLKVALLSETPSARLPVTLVLGHGYSRFLVVLLAYRTAYVGQAGEDKPTAAGISPASLTLAAIFALLPMALISVPWPAWLLPACMSGVLSWYFRARIDGYTGDCLGACQVICELSFYLGCAW
jgi:adenosylcobinamide-GDP ribazoletransferase